MNCFLTVIAAPPYQQIYRRDDGADGAHTRPAACCQAEAEMSEPAAPPIK
ncbi:hypothetical protein [Enterobacter hormaechei]|nr:hypothetical protein [Enterobacter hormaechei]